MWLVLGTAKCWMCLPELAQTRIAPYYYNSTLGRHTTYPPFALVRSAPHAEPGRQGWPVSRGHARDAAAEAAFSAFLAPSPPSCPAWARLVFSGCAVAARAPNLSRGMAAGDASFRSKWRGQAELRHARLFGAVQLGHACAMERKSTAKRADRSSPAQSPLSGGGRGALGWGP